MSWRRVPPVSSPIDPGSLLAAGLGIRSLSRDEIAEALCDAFSADDAVLTASGTEALTLALRASVKPGAVVALPGYACIDIVAAAQGAGVTVALYDVDANTMSPEPESLRATVGRGVGAIVVAPLYGYPVDMRMVRSLASEAGVPLIEDAAQSAGATLDGARVGALGDLTVLSFGRGKGMTGGSGGALLFRGGRFANEARRIHDSLWPASRGMRDIVALSAQWVLGRPLLYSIPASIPALGLGEMIYKPPREPARMSASAVSVLPVAMRMNDAEVAARRSVAARFTDAIARSTRFSSIQPIAGAVPGYLRFAIRDTRGDAIPDPHLGALRGYPITLDEHAETKRVLIGGQPELPGARTLRDRLFTLPTHSMVSAADIARLIRWLS
jgi:perosamine synthetase